MPEPTLTCKGLLHKLFYTPVGHDVVGFAVGDGLSDCGFELEPLADAVSCLWLGSIVE